MFRFYLLSDIKMHELSIAVETCLVLLFVCQAFAPQRIRLNYLAGHGSLWFFCHIGPLGIMCSVGVCYQNHTNFGVHLVTLATDSSQPGRSYPV